MKKNLLIAVLLGVLMAGVAYTAPRGDFSVGKSYDNNGNTRVGFFVSVASTAWTTILSADANRRYAVVHATSTSIPELCISTSALSSACTATLPGRHLPQVGIVFEDHNEAALYGRLLGGVGGSVYLLGEKQHDSAD